MVSSWASGRLRGWILQSRPGEGDRLELDLPDALRRDPELFADLLERVGVPVCQAIAETDDLAFLAGQGFENLLYSLRECGVVGLAHPLLDLMHLEHRRAKVDAILADIYGSQSVTKRSLNQGCLTVRALAAERATGWTSFPRLSGFCITEPHSEQLLDDLSIGREVDPG
jgi:hypothetical protein